MRAPAHTRQILLLTASVAFPICAGHAQAAAKPLAAKVQETLMGPTLGGPGISSRTYLSEDGDHIAVVTAKGSRQVVLLDGVEGPLFDEIPTRFLEQAQVKVQWSPTGGHSAYIGRRGGDFIAVIDGKEAGPVVTSASLQAMPGAVGYANANGWMFWFNHDGSRLAYAAVNATGFWIMMVDGVTSPAYKGLDFRQTLLNGKRLVYVAQTTDQQFHGVVDGKPGPGYAGIQSLQLTPDGLHYAFIATPPAARSLVVLDGVASGQAYFGVGELELSPDGRIAYSAVKTLPPRGSDRGGSGARVIAGKEISCGTTAAASCLMYSNRLYGGINTPRSYVAWSPDGKGVAYLASNQPNPGITVIVNGKPMGQTYLTVSELHWNADGTRFAYVGSSPTGFFMVVDGQELESLNDVPEFQWSPDGKRYAFIGKTSTVVDGKELPGSKGIRIRESFEWSSDSKHYAYMTQFNGSGGTPIVDGVAKPFYTEIFQPTTQSMPKLTFPSMVFSPDGAHLAYLGRTFDATGRGNSKAGVVIDGVRIEGPSESYMYPAWSSDGKHFGAVTSNGRGWAAIIDGKVGAFYETVLENNLAAARFTDPHTYRFYGTRDGMIYRVTLDIG